MCIKCQQPNDDKLHVCTYKLIEYKKKNVKKSPLLS